MPLLPTEADASFPTTPGISKRKRDPVPTEVITPSTDKLSPSSIHYLNTHFCIDYPGLSRDNDSGETLVRPRYLSKKHRLFQQSSTRHKQSLSDNLSHLLHQAKISSPALVTPTASKTYSPPVSPKTVSSSLYQHQQSVCVSAGCLRPCHICHRRPTTREFIDAYADCDLCGQRSCYICLRYCDATKCTGLIMLCENSLSNLQLDFNDNRSHPKQPRKICSTCAVEGVTESGTEVIRCLECVRGSPLQ
ncbi:hypothetical protein BO70DRAFT_366547 [Aspergillus heteromorphus CBS 117.55]|uniref:Uncharacterized protein n=1 Tax=Aspergillus heteromorphus CBS 117.55 TaxID=1448321 RepID=A0A317V0L7_9EURO|nr:uncharacterized protein BO70DRAFT_366547 [Aspergillus heteromorphus CBS 117.55]PWY66342.1 hypothetical protein BO70DRAFT_366547 [Aspergillus heteromorphus CBS 117.55]